MAEDLGMYKYEEMASKVLKNDTRLLDDTASTENVNTNPQSIKGIISSNDFGSRIAHSRSNNEAEEAKKGVEDFEKRQERQKNKKNKSKSKGKGKTLLDGSTYDLNYTPTTESNLYYYSQIIVWCASQLDNDVPEDVVNSLADIIIEVLKLDSTDKLSKKKELEDTLGKQLDDNEYIQLYDLVKQLTDYNLKTDNTEESGVGVILDSEESEEDQEDGDDDDDEENNSTDDGNENVQEDTDEEIDLLDEKSAVNQKIHGNNNIVKLINSNDPNQVVDIKSVNRFWLVGKLLEGNEALDSIKQEYLLTQIITGIDEVVSKAIEIKDLEERLSSIPELESGELFTIIMKNYYKIHYGIKLSEAKEQSTRDQLFEEMENKGLDKLLDDYKGKRQRNSEESEEESSKKQKISETQQQKIESEYPKYIDINNLKFTQGSHLMTTSTFQLPEGSFKRTRRSWEEIHIPPPAKAVMGSDERLVSILELPKWAQQAFPVGETTNLNRIQSKVYPAAFSDDGNILMCAPTGAGKTNVAMLTILHTLSKFRNSNGSFRLNDFKIVFIAPLKALVQEQVREFDRRLSSFGITVNELTGDSNLTKYQISNTQILVTTPEKWDVITRKNNDASFVQLVKLVIIDEIHLLHDERGPVLESIVSRALKNENDTQENHIRFVGLSATLPNYKDVAEFLNVDQNKGLFYFDSSYRPCPLAQQFIGITEKKAFKKYEAMNEVCYEKVVENINGGHQVIIFVHSRKETEKTAKWITNKILENDQLKELMNFSSGVNEILRTESENAKNKGLKEVLQMGIGIHHAGMTREDRKASEDLFAEGHIKVLVSTATLAWGVNLPAHTVIIKGTSVYSPEKGSWVNLSPQDILQMLGRAGRPRYDTHGEGIIITEQDEVKYYLAILNQQLPIESQLYSRLADNINAEIASGSITSLKDCISWIGYTYLYVRMLHSRSIYHVGPEYDNDPQLLRRRRDLSYSALVVLAKNGLIKYNFKKDIIVSTDLGKIASYYYISHTSIRNYDQKLKPYFNEIELFRIFATSEEFKYIPVRREEKIELQKLMDTSPIPINETVEDPLSKINILLQTYISRLKLDGFALMADMVYIVQSAGRLFRAMYDLATRKKWSRLSKTLLSICKMVEKRLWLTNSPLRQYPDAPKEIVQVTERSMTPWKYYLALDEPKLAIQALKANRFGNLGWELLQKFPQVLISYIAQPITPSLMRIQLELTPKWKWDTTVHGYSESFTLLVEDCDSEKVLYVDNFIVQKDYIEKVHNMDLTVPIFETDQPNYFVSVISDKWLHCETRIPIMSQMIIPSKFPAPTVLNDNALIQTSDLEVEEFKNVFSFKEFNRFQSDAFDAIYNTTKNIMFNTSKGNGKTVIAELALLNHWKNEKGRAVFISPYQEKIDYLTKNWKKRFGKLAGGKIISKLTGELNVDLKLQAQCHLILCTIEQFDLISRRWKQKKNIQSIELVIADDVHCIGDGRSGTIYENILSRMRFIDINFEKKIRFVTLGSSIASYKDFADWLDIPKHSIFDFDSRERIYPVEVEFQKFDIVHVPSLIKCCIRPAYDAISSMNEVNGEEKAIVFVPTRKHCVDIAMEFIKKMKSKGTTWLKADSSSLEPHLKKIQDSALIETLRFGIGIYYKGMHPTDKSLIEKLFEAGALTCLLAGQDTCYWSPTANFVVVVTTKYYYGKEHRYIDYKINDLLEMVGCSRLNNDKVSKALILTNSAKVDYYKRFLAMSLPIESHFNFYLHDLFLNDINFKLLRNRQDAVDILTYSLFYRRLQMNPSFYGIKDPSDDGLSEYLSELVENTLQELADAKLIQLNFDDEINDMDRDEEEEKAKEEEENAIEVTPDTGCMIASHHDVSYITLQIFMQSLSPKTRLKKLLEIVSSADEFDDIPIRLNEDNILSRLYNSLPVKWTVDEVDFDSPKLKTFILLQAYFSRVQLNVDLTNDLKFILGKVMNLLYACVDILSSESNLNAMTAMDLAQMVVQGMWSSESPLKQIPNFSDNIIQKCEGLNVKNVYEFMEIEDDVRDDILSGLTEDAVSQVAEFVNKYPNLDLNYNLNGDIVAGEVSEIIVEIERDEDVEDSKVVSSQFPLNKQESWWIVLGNPELKKLYAIKKTELLGEKEQIKLKFTIPDTGKHNLCIWCVSDSFCDADKQIEIGEVDIK